jgi:superfamily II DNA or RNA helicase
MAKLDDKKFGLLNERFGQIIADEVHIVGAETYYHTMTHLSAKFKFGFSATPKRDDGLTQVIHFATGPTIYKVDPARLTDVLVKPSIVKVTTKYEFPIFSSDEYQALITDLSEDKDRNQLIVDTANSDEYKNKTACFLCVRLSQVEALKKHFGDDAEILTSKMTKKQRRLVMEKLLNGTCKKIISTYALFSTGIDIPHLDLAFLCAPLQSEVKIKQTAGRLMRKAPGKENATLVDFVDEKVSILKYQYYKRRRIYEKLWSEK